MGSLSQRTASHTKSYSEPAAVWRWLLKPGHDTQNIQCGFERIRFFIQSTARGAYFGLTMMMRPDQHVCAVEFPPRSAAMPRVRGRLLKSCFGLFAVTILVLSVVAIDSTIRARFPDEDMGKDSLPSRKKAQLEDRVKESGITFKYRAVDDVTKHMRMGHYDHGSGVAVADVDGDGLYDIYFVNQVGGNELWKNLGNGKFKNITQEAGVALPGRISVAAAFADIDNDGDQDLFVATVRGGNALLENDGHGHFADITHEAGLDLVAHSSGALLFDYDNDGLLDLLVCNVGKYTEDTKGPDGEYVGIPNAFDGHLHPDRYEYPVLYKNMGHNRFKDVTA